MKEMKTLTLNGNQYEIVDEAARNDLVQIKEDLTPLKKVVSWSNFGTIMFPGGWRYGYYNRSDGAINASNKNAICLPSTAYIPSEGLKKFSIKVPDGYSVLVSEYDFDSGYIGPNGTIGRGSEKVSSVTIVPKGNCYYKFSVGWFSDGSAEQHLDASFTEQIVLTEEYYAGFSPKKHLNILLFGNSYFADSWAFVPFILKKYGITCNIHFYYRGSGSIDRLVAEWEDSGRSGLDDFGVSHVRRYAHIDTRYFRAWEQNADHIFSPKEVLEKANTSNFEWDIIVLSSGSRSQSFTTAPGNGDPRKGAEPYIRQAIDLINATYNKPYHLAWFGLYTSFDGYAGNPDKGYPAITPEEMDNRVGVLKSTETIMGAEPFDFVIPAGSAVFNARTNVSLASTALSVTGNLWCSDKVHLQAGIPNYIANCAVVQSIFNKFYPHLSILGDDTRVTDALITRYACPFIKSWCGSVMDSTELLYELGQKAAFMACKYPFDITPIYLPTDDTALAWFDSHSDRYWADALITRPADT